MSPNSHPNGNANPCFQLVHTKETIERISYVAREALVKPKVVSRMLQQAELVWIATKLSASDRKRDGSNLRLVYPQAAGVPKMNSVNRNNGSGVQHRAVAAIRDVVGC